MKTALKRSKLLLVMMLMLISSIATANGKKNQLPKYVFFFLGDGMSAAQTQAAEAYLTTLNGGSARNAEDLLLPMNRLNMSKMDVLGMQTTFDSYALMTDSASSATAFASGHKTRSGTIGMDPTLSVNFKSVAEMALEQGKKVGVITSVSLDHATPAAYYASVTNRGLMNSIATQLANSGYHFFGGGGLVCPTSACRSGDTSNNVWEILADNGYTVLNDYDSIMSLHDNPMDKVVAINPYLQDSQAMPYAIDIPDGNLSLAEMTDVAVSVLSNTENGNKWGCNKWKKRGCGNWNSKKNDKGFFLMVEGGKIDWACHANDAMATIGDVLDFDDAIGIALSFYYNNPNETLIIVTGDHETGGMTVGHATTAYTAYYEKLLGQNVSFQHFGANQMALHKEEYQSDYDWTNPTNLEDNPEIIDVLFDAFGLDYYTLNNFQKEKLEDAYDKTMSGMNGNSSPENTLLYGGYDPFVVTVTHILNEISSIGWTSYSHTGVPIPLFAQGNSAERFAGFYDNTDIAKRLAVLLGVETPLPIEK